MIQLEKLKIEGYSYNEIIMSDIGSTFYDKEGYDVNDTWLEIVQDKLHEHVYIVTIVINGTTKIVTTYSMDPESTARTDQSSIEEFEKWVNKVVGLYG